MTGNIYVFNTEPWANSPDPEMRLTQPHGAWAHAPAAALDGYHI